MKFNASDRFREKCKLTEDLTIMPTFVFKSTDFLYKCVICKYLLFLLCNG